MVAREVSGMILVAIAGLGLAALLSLSTLMKNVGLPYFAITGAANLTVASILLVFAAMRGELSQLNAHQCIWVFLRGVAGTGAYALALLAIAVGAPLGDVSALQSVNLVAAAFLGRVFLGERLRLMHMTAVCISLCGALLVANVFSHVNGGGAAASRPWLGHTLALCAGFVSGVLFIASRKSQGINPLIMTSSVTFQEGVLCCFLPSTGMVSDAGLHQVWASPLESLAVFGGMLLLVIVGSGSLSAGSQLCPAAASSTIFTSVGMSASYAAQLLFQSQLPQPITLVGASMMLFSVALMAFARWFYAAANVDECSVESAVTTTSDAGSSSARVDDVESESLARFVASEFSGISLRERLSAKVRRANATAVFPHAQGIGAAVAVA